MLSLIAGRTIARQAQLMAVFQCCNRVYATKAVKAPKEKKAPKTAKVPKEKPMPKPKEKKTPGIMNGFNCFVKSRCSKDADVKMNLKEAGEAWQGLSDVAKEEWRKQAQSANQGRSRGRFSQVKKTKHTGRNLFAKDRWKDATAESIGDKNKEIAEMWKSSTPAVQEEYNQKAAAMNAAAETWNKRQEKKRNQSPRRKSAYQIYSAEHYSGAEGESMGDKMRWLAEKWQGETDAVKAKYQQQADEANEPINKETEAARKARAAKYVSGYVLFTKQCFKAGVEGADLAERSKNVAAKWKALSDEQKEAFKAQAAAIKAE
jgi:hypothetical protein